MKILFKKRFIFTVAASLMLSACSLLTSHEKKGPEPSAQAVFNEAETALAQKNFNTAVRAYEKLDTLDPFSPYAEKALLHSIYAYYETGDYALANAAAARFIRRYPASPAIDYAWYMKGRAGMLQDRSWPQRYFSIDLALRDLTAAQAAFEDFAYLVSHYPQSLYAPDARQRMIYLKNLFAQHELALAKFYYQKKAFVAAANRASNVVIRYNGSDAEKEALEIMAKAYTFLGDTDQAHQAEALLKRYF